MDTRSDKGERCRHGTWGMRRIYGSPDSPEAFSMLTTGENDSLVSSGMNSGGNLSLVGGLLSLTQLRRCSQRGCVRGDRLPCDDEGRSAGQHRCVSLPCPPEPSSCQPSAVCEPRLLCKPITHLMLTEAAPPKATDGFLLSPCEL